MPTLFMFMTTGVECLRLHAAPPLPLPYCINPPHHVHTLCCQVWSVSGYMLRGRHEGHTAPVTCLAVDANFLFRCELFNV